MIDAIVGSRSAGITPVADYAMEPIESSMGRGATGVWGIRPQPGDEVVDMVVCPATRRC